MNYGFVRTAAVTPKMRVADVEYNVQQIIQKIDECAARGVQLAVFPELCISGYTCADLFFSVDARQCLPERLKRDCSCNQRQKNSLVYRITVRIQRQIVQRCGGCFGR